MGMISAYILGFNGVRFYGGDKMSKYHSAVNKVLPEFEDASSLETNRSVERA